MTDTQITQKIPNAEISTEVKTKRLNPAQMYLLRMNTEQSRIRVAYLADTIARIFGAKNYLECDWSQMRREHVLLVIGLYEKKGAAPATINLLVAIMRGIAEEAWNLRLIDDHEYSIIRNVKNVRGSRESAGRALSNIEVSRLFALCDANPTVRTTRDAAVLALGLGCGLRRAEIIGLKLSGIHTEDQSISVIGKGNKERRIYCSSSVWERLDAWLQLRGNEGVPRVFCRLIHGAVKKQNKTSYLDTEHSLTLNNIYMILHGFEKHLPQGKHFSPHDLRRTYATRLFEQGEDIDTVRRAMGHSSVVTTQKYDKRSEEGVRRATRKIQL